MNPPWPMYPIWIMKTWRSYFPMAVTLPETNISPENGWLEDLFPFGKALFQGRPVSFQRGTFQILRPFFYSNQDYWRKSILDCWILLGNFGIDWCVRNLCTSWQVSSSYHHLPSFICPKWCKHLPVDRWLFTRKITKCDLVKPLPFRDYQQKTSNGLVKSLKKCLRCHVALRRVSDWIPKN